MSKLTVTSQHNRTARLVRVCAIALLATAFALLPTVAHADSNNAYTVTGTTQSGGTISGNLDFQYSSATTQTTLINSNFTMDGISFSCNGLTGGNQCVVFTVGGYDYFQVLNGPYIALIDWNAFNLAGTFPSSFNLTNGYFENMPTYIKDGVTGGSANFVTTPEPSAIFLLGAGLVGLLALSRRRVNAGSIA